MYKSCWGQQNLRACNFGQNVLQLFFFFLAGFLLPDIFLIPLDCTIREGWPSLGKIKNDPNHWPKSCLWNLKLHLLGRKIVFWVWVVFFFKTHFQMLTSWMLSYQFGLENRRVGKHFFKLGGGRSSFLNSLSAKKQEIPRSFFFFPKDFLVTLPDLTPKVNCPILWNIETFCLPFFQRWI